MVFWYYQSGSSAAFQEQGNYSLGWGNWWFTLQITGLNSVLAPKPVLVVTLMSLFLWRIA